MKQSISEVGQACCGCEACRNSCPQGCITMKEDAQGFLFPNVDEQLCVGCSQCVAACPVVRRKEIPAYTRKTYLVKNRDEQTRSSSSSGGVFIALAEQVIRQGGVVFGVRLDEQGRAVHSWADSIPAVQVFRFSKYVQSYIGDSYAEARRFLEDGRVVLFTGTPCQTEGLLGFLGRKYTNLLTIDIACHGVPSPKVWRKYLEAKGYEFSSGASICFRDKAKGWRNYGIVIPTKGRGLYTADKKQDLYLKGFLANLFLRECCYSCRFKTFERNSDITLSDCWGVKKIDATLDDDRGISLVITHSKEGETALAGINDCVSSIEIPVESGRVSTGALLRSSERSKKREAFFCRIDTAPIEQNIRESLQISLLDRIADVFDKVLKRLGVRRP